MPPEAMAFRETMIAERPMMLPAQELNELNTTMMSSESLSQRGAQLNGVMMQVSGGVIAPQAADVRGMMRQAGGAERGALRDMMEASFMDWKQSVNEQQQARPMRPSISKSSITSWQAASGAPQPEISKSALVQGLHSHASGRARDFKQSERSTTPERSTSASSTSADQPARGERTTTDKPSGEQAASTSQNEQTKTSELSTSATMLSTDLAQRRAATGEPGATFKEITSQQPIRPPTDAQPAATVYGEQAALSAATQPIGSSLKTASSARSLQPAGGQSSESVGVSDSSMPSGLRMLSAEPRAVASGAQEQTRAGDQPVELTAGRSEALPASRQPESIRNAVQERLHSSQQDEVAQSAETASRAIAATQKDAATSQPEKTASASQSLSSAERARLMTGRSEQVAAAPQSAEQTTDRSEQSAMPEQSSEAAARAGAQDRAEAKQEQHDAEREAQAAASKSLTEREVRTPSAAELEAIYNLSGPEDPLVGSGSGGFRNDNDGRDGRGGWGGGGNEGRDGGGGGDRGDGRRNGGDGGDSWSNNEWLVYRTRDGSLHIESISSDYRFYLDSRNGAVYVSGRGSLDRPDLSNFPHMGGGRWVLYRESNSSGGNSTHERWEVYRGNEDGSIIAINNGHGDMMVLSRSGMRFYPTGDNWIVSRRDWSGGTYRLGRGERIEAREGIHRGPAPAADMGRIQHLSELPLDPALSSPGRGGPGGPGRGGGDRGNGRRDGSDNFNGNRYTWRVDEGKKGMKIYKVYVDEHGNVLRDEHGNPREREMKMEELYALAMEVPVPGNPGLRAAKDPSLRTFLDREHIEVIAPEFYFVDKINEFRGAIHGAQHAIRAEEARFAQALMATPYMRGDTSPRAEREYVRLTLEHAHRLDSLYNELGRASSDSNIELAQQFARAAQLQNWWPGKHDEWRIFKVGSPEHAAHLSDREMPDSANENPFGEAGSIGAFMRAVFNDVKDSPKEVKLLMEISGVEKVTMSDAERQALQNATGGQLAHPELLEGAINKMVDRILSSNNWRTLLHEWTERRMDMGTSLGTNRRHNIDKAIDLLKESRQSAKEFSAQGDAKVTNLRNIARTMQESADRNWRTEQSLAQSERIAEKQLKQARFMGMIFLMSNTVNNMAAIMNQATSGVMATATAAARAAGS